jgi:hypothetical protein
MRRRSWLPACLVLAAAGAAAQPGIPPSGEVLTYEVNWPSGLSLGEAQFKAGPAAGAAGGWDFSLSIDAAIPGFSVSDRFRSRATEALCSIEFEKNTAHGKRLTHERVTFDPAAGTARRETIKGGQSELALAPCAKDALAFLYCLRRELAQGRLPGAQTVIFGGEYRLRLEHGGRQQVRAGGREFAADRILVTASGQASETSIEVFLAQDAVRRPLLVRVPLALGAFSLELVP